MLNKATIRKLGKKEPDGANHGEGIHRDYLNPKEIQSGKDNGFVTHKSGHVFYHDADRKDFYLHPPMKGEHVKLERNKSGNHVAYLRKNTKSAINAILKS